MTTIQEQYTSVLRRTQDGWAELTESLLDDVQRSLQYPLKPFGVVDPSTAIDEVFDFQEKLLGLQRDIAKRVAGVGVSIAESAQAQAKTVGEAVREQADVVKKGVRQQAASAKR
jgi:hypothetical protein